MLARCPCSSSRSVADIGASVGWSGADGGQPAHAQKDACDRMRTGVMGGLVSPAG